MTILLKPLVSVAAIATLVFQSFSLATTASHPVSLLNPRQDPQNSTSPKEDSDSDVSTMEGRELEQREGTESLSQDTNDEALGQNGQERPLVDPTMPSPELQSRMLGPRQSVQQGTASFPKIVLKGRVISPDGTATVVLEVDGEIRVMRFVTKSLPMDLRQSELPSPDGRESKASASSTNPQNRPASQDSQLPVSKTPLELKLVQVDSTSVAVRVMPHGVTVVLQ